MKTLLIRYFLSTKNPKDKERKMSKSKLMIFLLVAVFFVFSAKSLLAEEGYKVQYVAEFSKGELSFDKQSGYDVVTLLDGDFIYEQGKPMLPLKELKIALPAGMAVKSVNVLDTKSEVIPGEYNIFPSQPPIKIGVSDKDVAFVQPDPQTYASSQPYPSKLVEFVHQTDLAGQGMAVILVYPLQYTPAQKKLELYTSITLIIEGVGGYEYGDYLSPNISEKERRDYERMVKDMVQNPQDVQLQTSLRMSISMIPPGGPFAHVIITGYSYMSYFQPLVDWHNQKGVRDTVVSTAWIYANYTADSDTQKIRAFVIDANSTWGTTYFLIGGETETVPFCYRTYYNGESTPSDEYYSDYDNDWTNEVYVGRVSVGGSGGTEVTTVVNKILKYEKDPPRTNYPLDVLLIGMDLDATTHAELLKDNIRTTVIPTYFNVNKVYDSHGGVHTDSVIYYLNQGQNLVNHADHCNVTVMGTGDYHHGWGIYNADVDALTNDNQLSVVVSLGCRPNYMDYGDCIAEHWVLQNANQAGVAFTGNTRDGWGYVGQPFSLSGALDKDWWVALFSHDKYNLGQTLADAKHQYTGTQAIDRHVEWTFSLLGEPEMPVWTDEPDSFAVEHASTIPRGTSSFLVHVEDSTTHTPVNQAYVCLWKAGEVYLTGYTNASGDVTLNPSPSSEGTMNVTITKHNYLPRQTQVTVLPFMSGDANGDGTVNSADVVYLTNYLFVGGPAPNPLEAGDANCDGSVNSADIVYLTNYLFVGGPPPGCK
jgi:hypothetical protein